MELGALASGVLLFTFRHETQPISATVETEVTDTVPSTLMLLTVGLLITASFLPEPAGGPLHTVYGLRSGLVCMGLCLFGIRAPACGQGRQSRWRMCWASWTATPCCCCLACSS